MADTTESEVSCSESNISIVFLPELKLCHEPVKEAIAYTLNHPEDHLLFTVGGDALCNVASLPSKASVPGNTAAPGPCAASVTERLVALCRSAGLVSPRATLLTVKEQQQALLLCLARRNKEIHGEFSAVASDLLDAWAALSRRTFDRSPAQLCKQATGEPEPPSLDPVEREMSSLLDDYRSFIKSSNNIDQFLLFDALSKAVHQRNPALLSALNNTVLVLEGAISAVEWQLVSVLLRCRGCSVYTSTLEQMMPLAARGGNNASFDLLEISGIDDELQCTPDPPSLSDVCSLPVGTDFTSDNTSSSATTAVFTHNNKKVQLCLTLLQQHQSTTLSDIQSKCLNCYEETKDTIGTDSSISSALKTPLPGKLSKNLVKIQPKNPKVGSSIMTGSTILEAPSDSTDGAVCTPKATPVGVRSPARKPLRSTPGNSEVRCSPRTVKKQQHGQACHQYIQQVMLSQLRLLLNTRDELALAINCSLPGTELTQAAFADIKAEAHSKNMPMFQTILSVVMKLRLGGSGYQKDAGSAILTHVKPLSLFVDHITKLTTILEDETNHSNAATKILSRVRRYLVQQCSGINSKDCALKVSTVESVHEALLEKLNRCCVQITEESEGVDRKAGAGGIKLAPALRMLQRLCDTCAGQCSVSGESAVTLVDDGNGVVALSQGFNSPHAQPHTPLRIPSVLTLFRTPPAVSAGDEDDNLNKSLRMRLMRGIHKTPARPKMYQSCMSWAPDNLSPILGGVATPSTATDASPGTVLGPTLVAAAPPAARSSQHWQEVIASLPDRQEEEESESNSTKTTAAKKSDIPSTTASSNIKKRSSKRSLLTDISNLSAEDPEANDNKKRKSEAKDAPATKVKASKKAKAKPLPTNQRSIMSFFKTS